VSRRPLQLRTLLEHLLEGEVRFVLVGGLAVNAWGYLRGTRDIDLVPDPASPNLERLATVLEDLEGRVQVGDGLLEAAAIRTFLAAGDRTLITTSLGDVDVLQGHPQVPGFAVLDADAEAVDMDGLQVRVCSLAHLLDMKRASDRARDRDDLEALEAARGD